MAVRAARNQGGIGVAAALAVMAVLGGAAPAWANGAFPDAFQILLPALRPQQIVLGTNFGLMLSDDDGKTWSWTCEHDAIVGGNLYQQGPAPAQRIFALSLDGLVHSDDQSCTWTASGGTFPDALAFDAFPDQGDATRVWAIAQPPSGGQAVYLSTNGGNSFGAPAFVDDKLGGLTSIESARSDPQTVYVAMHESRLVADSDGGGDGGGTGDGGDAGDAGSNRKPFPLLLRSSDGGAHWDPPIDLQATLGFGIFRLIAVDPTNKQRLFIRFTSSEARVESLAISDDGGVTFRIPIRVDGNLWAFLRTSDGTLLVAAETADGWVGYRSTDGGATFSDWPGIPRIRGLAERGGRIYAAADWVKDGYALGVSTDGGVSFSKLMTFSEVGSVRPCVQDLCRDRCLFQAGVGLWPNQTCGVAPPPITGPAKKTGCGCQLPSDGRASLASLASLLALVVAALAARRRSRR